MRPPLSLDGREEIVPVEASTFFHNLLSFFLSNSVFHRVSGRSSHQKRVTRDMSETSTSASLAAATAAASPGIVNWADDVDDELKPAASTAAAKNGGDDDDDAPPGFEHVSPAAGGGAAADPADALVAKIGGVAVSLEEEAGIFLKEKRD